MVSPDRSESGLPDQPIPARIVIGVTGHRKLSNWPALSAAMQSAIGSIRQMVPPLRNTPLSLSVLSPLAEGADRLVALEILKVPGAVLEVVLPLGKEDYMHDFQTEESREEFEGLISRANSIRRLPSRSGRPEVYERVGHYVVDQCDVLIALWDGQTAARCGGTEEIVAYARKSHCTLIWIHADDPSQITVEMGRGIDPRPFQELDSYNAKRVNAMGFEKQLKEMRRFFESEAESSRLPPGRLNPVLNHILGCYVRADILALHYQHRHYRAETLVYALSLAAVVIASFQTIFLPQQRIILTTEVALMLVVLAVVFVNRRQRWHSKWIDYRFLAERFRSALFMELVNIDIETLRPPRHLSLAYTSKDWMVGAFFAIWNKRPKLDIVDLSLFEKLKSFIGEAWIQDQIRYHDGTRKRHYRRYHRMTVASYVMFGLTICVTLLLIVNVVPLEAILAFAATVFPATAASIAAIRTQRDYLRNSMRSAEMLHHLEEIKGNMMASQDTNSFLELVKEAEETMLHENEDWRVVVRFHRPEVPV